VLGDAAGLVGGDIGLAQRVEQAGLAVVHVAHDGDDGRARQQRLLLVHHALEADLDVALGHALHAVAEFLHDKFRRVGVDGLRQRRHHAHAEQRLHHLAAAGGHAVGEFLDGDRLRHHHVAHHALLAGAQAREFLLPPLAFAGAAHRGDRADLLVLALDRRTDVDAALAAVHRAAERALLRRDRRAALLGVGAERAAALILLAAGARAQRQLRRRVGRGWDAEAGAGAAGTAGAAEAGRDRAGPAAAQRRAAGTAGTAGTARTRTIAARTRAVVAARGAGTGVAARRIVATRGARTAIAARRIVAARGAGAGVAARRIVAAGRAGAAVAARRIVATRGAGAAIATRRIVAARGARAAEVAARRIVAAGRRGLVVAAGRRAGRARRRCRARGLGHRRGGADGFRRGRAGGLGGRRGLHRRGRRGHGLRRGLGAAGLHRRRGLRLRLGLVALLLGAAGGFLGRGAEVERLALPLLALARGLGLALLVEHAGAHLDLGRGQRAAARTRGRLGGRRGGLGGRPGHGGLHAGRGHARPGGDGARGRALLHHLHLDDLAAPVAEGLPHAAAVHRLTQVQASARPEREPALP
jgi:hypothetical protein